MHKIAHHKRAFILQITSGEQPLSFEVLAVENETIFVYLYNLYSEYWVYI
jgi:hypothetical protein